MRSRPPLHPALQPVVQRVWSTEGEAQPAGHELVLPTGTMHLALRLGDEPLRLYDGPSDRFGRTIGTAVVGGARSVAHLRDVSRPAPSVGAQLRPGAASFFFEPPAAELAERHTELGLLWGPSAAEMQERLAAQRSHDERLDLFEALLLRRLRAAGPLHPAIAFATRRLAAAEEVGAVVAATGWSHRHFVARFHTAIGLHPKAFSRVLRLQRALRLRVDAPVMPWAELALAAGYSDQSHLSREFRALTSLSPGAWGRMRPHHPNHVPLPR